MLMTPKSLGFNYVTGNVLTTRPAAAFGTSIAPGNNTYGSYTEILSDASVTKDCYGILININSIGVIGTAKDSLTTIGIDTSGGTSYSDFISHLGCSNAGTYLQGGHYYYFPVFIPAGTAIAAKGSTNNATVGTQNIAVWLFGAPSDLKNLVYGYGVETIGAVTASSTGTAVTPGTTSEGSWTSLGTSTKPWKACQYAYNINDSGTLAQAIHCDLSFGNGTNQVILGQDKVYRTLTNNEDLNSFSNPIFYPVPSSSGIYGRAQSSTSGDTGTSMIAYGVY